MPKIFHDNETAGSFRNIRITNRNSGNIPARTGVAARANIQHTAAQATINAGFNVAIIGMDRRSPHLIINTI